MHREFAKIDEVFKKACELAKVSPTVRQASKFRLGRGAAYVLKKRAISEIEKGKKKKEHITGKENNEKAT